MRHKQHHTRPVGRARFTPTSDLALVSHDLRDPLHVRVFVESTVGVGSVFAVRLPAASGFPAARAA
jgi:hypothetical protein